MAVAGETSLADAARAFFSRRGPRRIAKYAGAAWATRAAMGRFGTSDLAVVAAVAAWWPLQEWLAHKHLLHLEPKAGRDPLFAKRHRAHHEAPRDLDNALLPEAVLDIAMPANVALWLVALGPRRVAFTGVAAYASMALVYEWIHFLVHTEYRPKSAYFRKVRANHHLHHRSEAFWFAFTLPLVDELLGTAPDPASVPQSKTARDLFGLRGRFGEDLR